jgi:hypothetical protein
LTRNPDALSDPESLAAINKLTSGSRLIFLDSEGKVTRTSESSWNQRYGLMLSNTYMLPSEVQTPKYSSSSDYVNSKVYNSYRTIKYSDGSTMGTWCTIPKVGFVMTEAGHLYIDQGAGQPIEHKKWFIDKANHEVALAHYEKTPGKAIESAKVLLTLVNSDDVPAIEGGANPGDAPILDYDFPYDYTYVNAEDDEVAEDPADEDEQTYTVAAGHGSTVGEMVATRDVQLRYARFMHNCHHGNVANRGQLVADVMNTGNDELLSLIKEDPETAHTILTELFEIFIEQNDILNGDEETQVYAFNPDDMLNNGQLGYHREGMKAITESRRIKYEQMVKDRADAAFKKTYPDTDVGSAAMEAA